jgi:general secretion pathway protein E
VEACGAGPGGVPAGGVPEAGSTALDDEAAAALGIPGEVVARARARRRDGRTLGEALAELGAADVTAWARALAAAAGLPFAAAPPAVPGRDLTEALPMPFARHHLVLPLALGPAGLEVAAADPGAVAALDDLRFLYRAPVRPLVVPAPALRVAITRAYDAAADSAADTMEAIEGARLDLVAGGLDAPGGEPLDLLEAGDEAPVIRLVNSLLFQAVREGASDIHIEPYDRAVAVRFRVDGLLHDVLAPPPRLHASIASRVKVMARLDVAERRLPQDGRIQVRVAGRDVDVRVSLVPTAFGERVVLRLLDRAAGLLDLGQLGLSPPIAAAVDRLLTRSTGIVLVTGPTGSGKTTTLYAALRRLATGERNIVTIEDPIEYQIQGIAQVQVNPRIDLTFAAGLRAVLRQDPDVILVGEIRDRETVEIAMRAALTGHLVFSTLHTNDACGAVTRLLDMGVEPFLISSSVLAVLAQRLVRRPCPGCCTEDAPTAEERRIFGDRRPARLRHAGPGCATCRGTAYRGRLALHELLVVDDPLRALVMGGTDAGAVRRLAAARGMARLRDDGLDKAAAGLTTVAEVVRVTDEEP